MRTKKAFKNITTSMLYQVVSIVCGLITPRLILSAFGSTYNGVVSSATQFLSAISLLTVGIAGSTRLALYKTLAKNDIEGTSRIMKANKLYMRKVALCLLGYALVLSLVYPFISHNDLTRIQSGAIVLIVSLGTFAEYFFGMSSRTLLSADQSGYVDSTVNIIKVVSNTILTAILIRLGCSIFLVKLGSSIVFFLCPLAMNFYVSRKYRLIRDCAPDMQALDQRKAVAYHSIANIVHNHTDLLILTVFTDAKIISVYTVYYLVVGKVKSLMTVFTNGLESAFGNMWAKGEREALERNFSLMEYSLFSFTAVVFTCVGLLILPFIKLYTMGVTDTNYYLPDLAVLITLAEGMYCIRQPYLILVQATGHYDATKNGAILEAALNLLISICLVPFLGINGVIIGTLAANIIRTSQFAIFIYKNVIEKSLVSVLFRLLWVVLVFAGSAFVYGCLLRFVSFQESWIGWVFRASALFLICLLVTALMSCLFYKDSFNGMLRIFKRMIRKKRK